MRAVWTGIAMLWTTPVLAVDINDTVEAWTATFAGDNGNLGAGEAHDVHITDAGTIMAAGFVDGAAGHGTNGFVVALDPNQSVLWSLTDDAGPTSETLLSSDDAFASLWVDEDTDRLSVCGAKGIESSVPARHAYRAQFDVTNPVEDLWGAVETFQFGADGLDTVCTGLAADAVGDRLFVVGYDDGAANEGVWTLQHVAPDTGTPLVDQLGLGFVTADPSDVAGVPDRTNAMAVDPYSGVAYIVGAVGVAGAPGGDVNDWDWHVRAYDPSGVLLWQDTQVGGALLDEATAVIVAESGNVFVAGVLNEGLDNDANMDPAWRLVSYDGATGEVIDVEDSDELFGVGATSIAINEDGDILVAGWTDEDGTERWHVNQHSQVSLNIQRSWTGDLFTGDSRALAIAHRDVSIALAGYVDQGNGHEFAVAFLGLDGDGDGVADAADACPIDPNKGADEGVCGCGVDDVDTDDDGIPNCVDDCPTDGQKDEPGICGCGVDDGVDTDDDGRPDCVDLCPEDPDKTEPMVCGCGTPDSDDDGDGILICADACPDSSPGAVVDEFGCETDAGGSAGGGRPNNNSGESSGCMSAPAVPLHLLPLTLMAAMSRRNRRQHDGAGIGC